MQFKIISAGDFMAGENAHHFKRGIPSKFRNNYRNLVSDAVREVLSDGDLLFINFESSLADDRLLAKLPIEKAVYVAPLEALALLKSFDIPIVANVANNHFAQHGKKAARYTIDQLERNGIIVIGKNNQPVTLEMNGSTLKIWGVSLVKDQSDSDAYFKSSYSRLIEELNFPEKEQNEIRIISIHWGTEYHTLPGNQQKGLATLLAGKNVDLILGHHPHTVQPAEQINQTWVIYSHGNFLFDQNFSALTQRGLISRFAFPDAKPELYITQQKNFSITGITPVSQHQLSTFCQENHSDFNPTRMRIQMKTELLAHFYESNLPTFKMFASRFMSR